MRPEVLVVVHAAGWSIVAALVVPALGAQVPATDLPFDPHRPAIGTWIGDVRAQDPTHTTEQSDFAHFVVHAGSVVVFVPALGLAAESIEPVRAEGSRLSFRSRDVVFELEVDPGGQELVGIARAAEDGALWTFACTRTLRPGDAEQSIPYAGWARHALGLEAECAIVLAELPSGRWAGSFDLPLRKLHDVPLRDLRVEDGSLHASLPMRGAVITGEFTGDGAKLRGELRQGALAFELDLSRDDDYVFRELVRPQHPVPPFPYRSRELVARHPGGHDLAGTLTLPDEQVHGAGPYATAVMISGGGREDRDSTGLGHKPFLVIADHLTRHGVAVFRFDDRGVGGSRVGPDTPVGKQATSLLLATDTAAVVRRLRDEPELDPHRIGLIGHSEGGLIAPLVTLLEPDLAFLVLLAGPGVRGAELFRKQFELEWTSKGFDADAVASLSGQLEELQRAVVFGESPERVVAHCARLADAWVEAAPDESREALLTQFREFDSPWWRFVFAYDPAPVLATVRCPLLALNGTKDLQVWHEQNLDAIERAVSRAGGDVTAIRYEDRNHLFQPTATGRPSEYATIEITFDPEVLRDIVDWLGTKGLR